MTTGWVMFSYPENIPDTKMRHIFVSGLNKSGSRSWEGEYPDMKMCVWVVEGGWIGWRVSATFQTRRAQPCVWVVEGGWKGGGSPQTRERNTGVVFWCSGRGRWRVFGMWELGLGGGGRLYRCLKVNRE